MAGITEIQSVQPSGMQLSQGNPSAGGSDASSDSGEGFTQRPMGDRSATVKKSMFIHKQMPDPLPPALGSKEILQKSILNQKSATIKQDVLYLKQMPEPLPPALGSLEFLPKSEINQQSATVKRSMFIRKPIPDPLPSKIGEEDLPGGFRKEALMSGRKNPVYDLVKGVVQIDDVNVLFNAWA